MAPGAARRESSIFRSMKRSGLTPHLWSATLFLTAISGSNLVAQNSMAMPGDKAEKRAEAMLKRFDKNGDGRIDDDERADAKEIMLQEQVERITAQSTLPAALAPFRTEIMEMFDKNRDGRLDDEERNSAQRYATRQDRPVIEVEDLNKRFDKNGDGTIDAGERATIDRFLSELRTLAGV